MTGIKMSRYVVACAAAACALTMGTMPLLAQQDLGRAGTSWRWDGAVASGGSVTMYNVNGALHFTPSSDGSVHVQAEKHVHSGGDPATVHYAVVRAGNNLVICALNGDDATCDADGIHGGGNEGRGNDRRRNVTAEMSVQLPAGVRAVGSTVNGEVTADRIASDVKANTVNGAVRVTQVTGEVSARTVNGEVSVDTHGGTVSAETVNGSVDATMGSGGAGDMRFRTVNGSITIVAPTPLNADVELRSTNGAIDSKYPLNFDRRRRRAEGVIGSGGRHLRASTVNGSITLR